MSAFPAQCIALVARLLPLENEKEAAMDSKPFVFIHTGDIKLAQRLVRLLHEHGPDLRPWRNCLLQPTALFEMCGLAFS